MEANRNHPLRELNKDPGESRSKQTFMELKLYQVDAFTNRLFSGNPAAVCPLDRWLPLSLMQQIALENNLAETAFYVPEDAGYRIRWFTPATEVDLCGHATLAAAFVLFHLAGHPGDSLSFYSRSGTLTVTRKREWLTLDFPSDVLREVPAPETIDWGLDIRPSAAFKGKTDYMLVYEGEAEIRAMAPDFEKMTRLDCRGVIVTARGTGSDFVSRFFAPASGINEDPVTGSAHTSLTPYWSAQLGKKKLSAIQLSNRRGYLHCEDLGTRVLITGEARLYLTGTIRVDDPS